MRGGLFAGLSSQCNTAIALTQLTPILFQMGDKPPLTVSIPILRILAAGSGVLNDWICGLFTYTPLSTPICICLVCARISLETVHDMTCDILVPLDFLVATIQRCRILLVLDHGYDFSAGNWGLWFRRVLSCCQWASLEADDMLDSLEDTLRSYCRTWSAWLSNGKLPKIGS